MPELAAALLPADDHSYSDLMIDTFDQMHNTTDLSLLTCHFCGCGAVPADAVDRASC